MCNSHNMLNRAILLLAADCYMLSSAAVFVFLTASAWARIISSYFWSRPYYSDALS